MSSDVSRVTNKRIIQINPATGEAVTRWTLTNEDIDVNEAIILCLRRYPARNRAEFESYFGSKATVANDEMHAILNEAMRVEPDWNRMTLNGAGHYVEAVMHERYPTLTQQSLKAIANFLYVSDALS